jgi:hypothetical protein
MSTTEQVLSEFIDAWNAGLRPRAREYLGRVAQGPQRDELAEQIATWLEVAPAPELDDASRAAIRDEPALRPVLGSAAGDAGRWPELLPRLRERAGLGVGDVAARLVQRFGLEPGAQDRAAAYVERLERGDLEPARVSRRLLDALGAILGSTGAALADAAAFGAALRPAAPAAGAALLRAEGDAGEAFLRDLEVLTRAAMTPAPALDELDRLFTGGRDA